MMNESHENLQISYVWLEHDVNDENEYHEFLGVNIDYPRQQYFLILLDAQALFNRDGQLCWQRNE